VICLGDNVSTDEIAPTGPVYGALRSNIPQAAETVFIRIDPEFALRAKQFAATAIIAGENYGQGSSREHAAALPAYLGVQFILAKSYARIHRANLINFGIVPLEFAENSDWNKIKQGSLLVIENIHSVLEHGGGKIIWKTREEETIMVKGDFSRRDRDILLAGGLLNYICRKGNDSC
jgi:aconitate hydratase